MGNIIYGDIIAENIKNNIKTFIDSQLKKGYRQPHLVVILVGNNIASKTYVNGKNKDCMQVGIKNTTLIYDNITEESLINKIHQLNIDDSVDGILVQLPLPSYINKDNIIKEINPDKDVDGFTPINVGKMYLGYETFIPCTPKGIIKILNSIGINDLSGKHAVVIGRSNIVGKPIAQLLLNKNATITICHSKTSNIKEITKQADIIISAMGQAELIKEDWIKTDAIIIDVGINHDENGKICGDVDLENVINKVSYITPVPKGVGLLIRAMLLENTIQAYIKNNNINN